MQHGHLYRQGAPNCVHQRSWCLYTHRHIFTHKRLFAHCFFTRRRFYTQLFLYTDRVTQMVFTIVFTQKHFHADGFTHTRMRTHTHFYRNTLLHREVFYTQTFSHTHTQTHAFLHTHDGFQNVVFWFGWYISRNSMRAASCLALKNYDLSKLNCLKPCIFSFMCETAPKTWRTSIWSRCHCELSRGTGRYVHLLQGFPLPLQVLWRRLGHGSAKAVLCNFC